MPRGITAKTPERVQRARELRHRGLLEREIGEQLGVSRKTINAWLNDPEGDAAKRRKRGYAQRCVDCNEPTSGSEGRKEVPRCFDCGMAASYASGDRADTRRHAEREATIRAMWAENATLADIATALDTSTSSIGVDIARMRKRGVDVPYRQPRSRPRAVREATPCQ